MEDRKITKRLSLFEEFYHILDHWMMLKEEKIKLSTYFKEHNYYNIAIYGMGSMAIHIIEDLKKTDINIQCIIEKQEDSYFTDIEIVSENNESFPPLDVIIITDSAIFNYVKNKLKPIIGCEFVTLNEVVFSVI